MRIKSGLVSLLLLFLASAVPIQSRVPETAVPFTQTLPSPIPDRDRDVLEQRPIKVDLNVARKNSRLLLTVFNSPPLVLVQDTFTKSPSGSFIWDGHVDGQPASLVTLVIGNEVLIGNVSTQPTAKRGAAEYYEIRYLGNHVHVLNQIDPKLLPSESDPESSSRPQTRLKGPRSEDVGFLAAARGRRGPGVSKAALRLGLDDRCTADSSTIDVLVLYTSKAMDRAHGETAIKELIELAIQQANDSYGRSGVLQQLQLVHMELAGTFDEKSYSSKSNLSPLKTPGGNLAFVQGKRDDFGADIVGLIIELPETSDDCGQSKVMEDPESKTADEDAYAVVARRCAAAPGRWSLAHEFGHLMGARHDWIGDQGDKPFLFSHAFVQLSAPGKPSLRTMMAKCSSCERIPYWSNPAITYTDLVSGKTFALGETDPDIVTKHPTNNAMTLNNTAPIVANFRCHKP